MNLHGITEILQIPHPTPLQTIAVEVQEIIQYQQQEEKNI